MGNKGIKLPNLPGGRGDTAPQGRLKIFFGYAAGVGKTYAMLEAAHQAQKQGIDVVVGYVEPHASRTPWLCWTDWRSCRVRRWTTEGSS